MIILITRKESYTNNNRPNILERKVVPRVQITKVNELYFIVNINKKRLRVVCSHEIYNEFASIIKLFVIGLILFKYNDIIRKYLLLA